MVSFLVLYGTGEGQMGTVAARIADVFDRRGHDATTSEVDELPTETETETEFVRSNRADLNAMPTAFFQC